MQKVPLTLRGVEKLRQELEHLKRVERPRIIQAIAEARAHGDLKENAEYHSSREQQSFIEGRIQDIEHKLSNAQVIDVRTVNPGGRVVFGSTVEVMDTTTEESHRYQIVGEDESDTQQGLISYTSPIARAMIGKQEGDTVMVQTPGGQRELEIIEVRYE
ncbi:MAG: transcription elongation factor GreA [Pseudomonadota bacterium]